MRRFVLVSVVFLMALGLFWINSKPDGWDARLEPSPATRATFAGNPEFGEYIALTRSMIQEATAHLDDPPTSETIELRLPFNLAPDPERCPLSEEGLPRRGALFIHGLYDSPFLVADAARAFQARCYLARAVLLPGHGTIAGDLTQTELAEWMAALDFGLKSFEGAIDGPLVLVGYSTGGALAVLRGLEEQAEQGRSIDAIVGLAPGLHGPFELGRVRQFLGKLAWNFPRFQYISIHPAIDPIKYESFAFRAGYQYVELQNLLGDLETGP
ncbi:MAG: alpha/beta fold hydrolase, partial [Sphingomonadales bacterium]